MDSKIQKIVLFKVGQRRYGIQMPHVKNIQGAGDISESLKVPRFDLSSLFGEDRLSGTLETKKLIMVNQDDQQLALMVDAVDGVVNVEDHSIVPLPPVFDGHARSCFPLIYHHKGHVVLLINPVSIIDAEDMFPAEPARELGSKDFQIPPDMELDEVEIDSSILHTDESDPPELKAGPVFLSGMEENQSRPGQTPEEPEMPENKEAILSSGMVPDDIGAPGPGEVLDTEQQLLEQSIDVNKIEQILTRVVEEKVSGKLNHIFGQALAEPRLRS